MSKKIIVYIIIIIIILVAVFLSQQAYSGSAGSAGSAGKTLVSAATNQISAYLAKGTNSVISGAYSKLDNQIQSGGEAIQNAINQGKQKISATENYFSGIANSIAGKSDTNSCATPAGQ
jgi:type II secretory pathway pseudopilin PulG